jgi:hypothetical protein
MGIFLLKPLGSRLTPHRITLSALASKLGGTSSILDFGLPILDCPVIGLPYLPWLKRWGEL